MSDKARFLAPFILTLTNLKPSQRRYLIGCCNKHHLKSFEEVALNLLKGRVELSPRDHKVCRRWGKSIKVLASPKTSMSTKRHVLQKGGFLPALLPILATAVLTAVTNR